MAPSLETEDIPPGRPSVGLRAVAVATERPAVARHRGTPAGPRVHVVGLLGCSAAPAPRRSDPSHRPPARSMTRRRTSNLNRRHGSREAKRPAPRPGIGNRSTLTRTTPSASHGANGPSPATTCSITSPRSRSPGVAALTRSRQRASVQLSGEVEESDPGGGHRGLDGLHHRGAHSLRLRPVSTASAWSVEDE